MADKQAEERRRRCSARKSADAISETLCKRVRQLRLERGLSLDELSRACGVSRSMLSQIERGQVNPTLVVAFRVAESFGMSLAELVEMPRVTSSVSVIRADDHAHHFRSTPDCQLRLLSPLHLDKGIDFYEVRIKPGSALQSGAHFAGTREFMTVQKGKVRIVSGKDSEVLNHGDSASYRADVSHAIENVGVGEAIVYLVDIY